MRRRHHAAGADSYWPGYVDALTNVVLNLLFLIAIFATGVFSLGMAAAKRRAAALEEPVQVIQVVQEQAGPQEARIRVLQTDASGAGRVNWEDVRQVADKSLVHIGFSAEAVTISDLDRRALWTRMQPLVAERPQEQLLLWAVVDAEDATQRRAAYLRVMAVRDWLLASGVPANRIGTRLLPGGTDRSSGQMVYVLFQGASTDVTGAQPLLNMSR